MKPEPKETGYLKLSSIINETVEGKKSLAIYFALWENSEILVPSIIIKFRILLFIVLSFC